MECDSSDKERSPARLSQSEPGRPAEQPIKRQLSGEIVKPKNNISTCANQLTMGLNAKQDRGEINIYDQLKCELPADWLENNDMIDRSDEGSHLSNQLEESKLYP